MPPSASLPLPASSKAKKERVSWWLIVKLLWRSWVPHSCAEWCFLLMALASVVSQRLCRVATPLLTQFMVDSVTIVVSFPITNSSSAADAERRAEAEVNSRTALWAFIGATLGTNLLMVIRNQSWFMVAERIEARVAQRLFQHLTHQSLAFHIGRETGGMLHVVETGVRAVPAFLNVLVFELGATILEVVLSLGLLFQSGLPMVCLAVIISMVLFWTFTTSTARCRNRLQRKAIEADRDLKQVQVESLVNFETVKMYGAEEAECERYRAGNQATVRASLRFAHANGMTNATAHVIRNGGLVVGCALVLEKALRGELSVGQFVMVQLLIRQTYEPMQMLSQLYRMLLEAMTNLEKMCVLLSEDTRIRDADDALSNLDDAMRSLPEREGKLLEFDAVCFRYPQRQRPEAGKKNKQVARATADGRGGGNRASGSRPGQPSLGGPMVLPPAAPPVPGGVSELSFSCARGESIALVGASGSGKSTATRLLIRVVEIDGGAIRVAGVDVRRIRQSCLRRFVGCVAQETVLFHESIQYNLKYGAPDASDETIAAMLSRLGLETVIANLSQGMDTTVGERGARLSGGERQRVGIARVLLREPTVLVLDEATSALDNKTEKSVHDLLEEKAHERGTLLIAHRLSTIVDATEIVVLQRGEVVERGSHDELLAKGSGGVYSVLWKGQLGQLESAAKRTIGRTFAA